MSTSKDSSMMMSKDFIPSSSYTVSAVLVTTVVVAWFYSKKPKQRSDNVTRRWSYTSAGMAIGAFPAKANTPDPIINAVMFFQECPRTQEIVNQIVTKMLQYERLNSVYDTITGKSRPCENLDPQDLVRVIKVQGSDEDSLMAIVDQQMHHPLSEGSRGELLPWWEFLVLQNTGRGPSAVVWRSHHALADGISMVNIVEDIITDMDGNPVVNILPRSMEKKFKIQRSFFDIALGIFKGVGSFLYMMSGPFDDKTAFHQAGVDMVHSQKRGRFAFSQCLYTSSRISNMQLEYRSMISYTLAFRRQYMTISKKKMMSYSKSKVNLFFAELSCLWRFQGEKEVTKRHFCVTDGAFSRLISEWVSIK
jgi:hypothetical protein